MCVTCVCEVCEGVCHVHYNYCRRRSPRKTKDSVSVHPHTLITLTRHTDKKSKVTATPNAPALTRIPLPKLYVRKTLTHTPTHAPHTHTLYPHTHTHTPPTHPHTLHTHTHSTPTHTPPTDVIVNRWQSSQPSKILPSVSI